MKRVVKWISAGLGLLALALGAFLGYASYLLQRPIDAPYPPIRADLTPAGIERGKKIFDGACQGCHQGEGERAIGTHLADIPKPLGTFYTANITSDPVSGIGALKDEQIARILRYGVNRHGRKTIMPATDMGDADIAAVIGYLRSGDPRFAPDPTVQPASSVGAVGKAVFVLTGGTSLPDRPASGLPVPEYGRNIAYGEYMANEVLDCVNCHTTGFDPKKAAGPVAFAGGFEFVGTDGKAIYSANLTSDASGLHGWSEDDFIRAVRDGIRPDGTPVRYPMPKFRSADDVDLSAIYMYLRALPARESQVPEEFRRAPLPQRAEASAAADFARFGCTGCHGSGALYEKQFQMARSRSREELVRRIRTAGEVNPNTVMPTYASMIDQQTAERLADWIRTGG